MADRKISELTNITGANIADGDELVVVDTSASETKAITFGEFKNALDTATGFVSITGDTMTGDLALSGADITFGDNDKAIFGAGSDLQIYHQTTGTIGSFISDVGAGNLFIEANNLRIRDTSENLYIFGNSGADVQLYYAGAKKLATTSTGVDITGTLTSDGLTVDGDAVISNPTASQSYLRIQGQAGNVADTNFAGIEFYNTDPSGKGPNVAAFIEARSQDSIAQAGQLVLATAPTGSTPEGERATQRMRIDSAGDISFYEDTGTTAKFFWDASAESLGIGTTSPSSYGDLTLYKSGANDTKLALANNGNGGGTVAWTLKNDTAWDLTLSHNAGVGGQNLIFGTKTSGGESMRIDSSGNVGIGTSSPFYAIQVDRTPSASGFDGISVEDSSTVVGLFKTGSSYSFGSVGSGQSWIYSNTSDLNITSDGSGIIKFQGENGTERMRIDSSGNLLVGKGSPNGNTVGGEIRATGQIFATASSTTPMYIRRKGDNGGEMIGFENSNGAIGSVRVTGSQDNIIAVHASTTTNSCGLGFYSDNTVRPVGNTGTDRDALVDLGRSTTRFKDLYLSGGVFLGGTGSSNKLDDYEEGTWTPGVEFATVGSTATTANSVYTTGGYTKIGKAVTVEFNISLIVAGNGTGNLRLTGLPFTPSGVPAAAGKNTASSGHLASAITSSSHVDLIKLYGVGTYNLMASTGSGSWFHITNSNFSTVSPNSINGSFTYYTNS